jgi:hypothetical protein
MAASVRGETSGRHLALGHERHWSATSPQSTAALVAAARLVDRFADSSEPLLEDGDGPGRGHARGHARPGRPLREFRDGVPRPGLPGLPSGGPSSPIPEPSTVLSFVLGGGIVLAMVAFKRA